MTASELHLADVSASLDGEPVIHSVSLTVAATESVAIVGPSGGGKTTLLRVAAGAIRPDEGTVRFDGDPVDADDVALAYQGETLVDRRTALANVLVGRSGAVSWWRGLVDPVLRPPRDDALAALGAVGLADDARTRVDRLSAGERQRVALARALVQPAPVFLADEPTANLDPSTRETVVDAIQDRAGDRVLAVVLHDVGLARARFDRVVGLAGGRIQFDDPADQVTDEDLAALFADESPAADEPPAKRQSASPGREPRWYA